jgi:hypothetical protein
MTTYQRLGRYGLILGLVLVVTVAAGGLWYLFFVAPGRGMTVSKVEAMIAADLPPGTTRKQVEAWLDAQGIDHSYSAGGVDDWEGYQSVMSMAGVNQQNLGGTVRATVRKANVDLILPGEINVYFFFDKQDRLVRHLVRPFVYNF